MTHVRTIFIVGHYGFGNPGDEAILAGIIAQLRTLRRDLRLIVASGAPGQTEAEHSVEAVEWTAVPDLIKAIEASGLVLLGGGGLFHDYWPFDPSSLLTRHHSGLAYFCGLTYLAHLLGKPVMMYGIGVGPLRTAEGRAYTRAALQLAARITVRDAFSLQQIEALRLDTRQAQIVPDPALGAPNTEPPAVLPALADWPRPWLGVALRNWSINVSPGFWERQTAQALDAFIERQDGTVAFVPFWESPGEADDDARLAARVHSLMARNDRALILPGLAAFRQKAQALAACDLVLGMRLHACVLAVGAAVPVVALSYDPKVRSFMESVGLADYAIELAALSHSDLARRLDSALAQRDSLSDQLRAARPDVARGAAAAARAALDLLSAEVAPPAASEHDSLHRQTVIALARRLAAEGQRADDLFAAVTRRDATVLDLQRQLDAASASSAAALHETRQRDAMIAALQNELASKVAARDSIIRNLQAELHSAVSERDARLGDLQAELQSKTAERDALIRQLQSELDLRTSERDAVIRGLQSDLETRAVEHQAQVNDLARRLAAEARQREHLLTQHAAEHEQWRQAEADLAHKTRSLSAQLRSIHTSRYWKALGYYWRAVDGLMAARTWVSARAHDLARRWLTPRQRRAILQTVRPEPPRPPAPRPSSAAAEQPPGCDIFCLSIIDWDFRIQRPQHLLAGLARHGHRVYYIRPRFNSREAGLATRPIAGHITEVTLPGDAALSPYSDDWPADQQTLAQQALAEFSRSINVNEAVVLVQLPFWAPLALHLQKAHGWPVIYDCLDHHAGFVVSHPQVARLEDELIARSDLVLFTAETLHRRFAPRARRAMLLRNAADYDHFAPALSPQPVKELDSVPGPIVGYYGAIAEWFDYDLIRRAAAAHPDWTFALIGHTFGSDPHSDLLTQRNVRFLGEKPYAELPAYLSRFDVAVIPFKDTPLTRATDPVKLYEFLAAGKPVVATDLPELHPHKDLLYLASGRDQFVAQIERALREHTPARAAAWQAAARAHTWAARCRVLESALRDLFPRVSVVVVAYNNLELTRQCLDSLARTRYPNLEVIVVDNGSTDGTPDYVRRLAAEGRLTAIANGRNAGFAAANNQGLAQASGDLLVLLNNDVVVPPGWLSGLRRHLADPTVGLIGPVTNRTGNEAMIPTAYTTMAEMETFAQGRARDYAGQCFDIPVLAFYCVAFRREVWEKVGPLDEQFGLGMFEDDDYAQRVRRAGYRVACAEDVFVHHYGEAAFGALKTDRRYDELFEANRRRFEAKWGIEWQPHQAREQ